MISPVDVINLALARLSTDPIVSLDEGSDRADRMKPIWAISLHLFLNEHEWSFARMWTKPAMLSLDAGILYPFRHAYALPEDCIKLTSVHGRGQWLRQRCRRDPDYRVMLYEGGNTQALLTNADNVHIEYITTRVNLSNLPPEAIDAIACRVAVEYVLSRADSSQRGQELMQFYEMAVAKAKKNDAKASPPKRLGGDVYSRIRL